MVLIVAGTVDPLSFTVHEELNKASKPKANNTINILFISLQIQLFYFAVQGSFGYTQFIGSKLALSFMLL